MSNQHNSKILHIDTSSNGDASSTRKLSKAIVDRLLIKEPGASIKIRDLSKSKLPHLSSEHVAAFYTPPNKRSESDKRTISDSEEIVSEVLAADHIVIGFPMFNFSIPSVLKAWIDHMARVGVTFRYSDKGPEGLLIGKKVYLAIGSGGIYSDGPYKSRDFTEPYLRAVLGFVGLNDVTVFRVEGTGIPGMKEKALEKAIASVNV